MNDSRAQYVASKRGGRLLVYGCLLQIMEDAPVDLLKMNSLMARDRSSYF